VKIIPCLAALLFAAVPALAAQSPASADTGRVYEVAQVDTRPRATNVPVLLAALQDGYPAALREAGREGRVVVTMVVGADGDPRDVQVVTSSDAGFDSATVAAVRLLRFTPGAHAGRPVAVRVELPVLWRLPLQEEVDSIARAAAAEDSIVETGMRVFEMDAVETPPRPRNLSAVIREMRQLYPEPLRVARMSGTVEVRLRVDVNGDVQEAQIIRSTHRDFNRPTLEVARRMKFTPARVNGRPVPVLVVMPLMWQAPITAGNDLP